MNDFTSAVVVYVLLVAFLVIVLLGAGLLIVNLGLLSKRKEDRIGHRDPSDVGVLRSNVWPEEPQEDRVLPAVDLNDPGSAELLAEDEKRAPERAPDEPAPSTAREFNPKTAREEKTIDLGKRKRPAA